MHPTAPATMTYAERTSCPGPRTGTGPPRGTRHTIFGVALLVACGSVAAQLAEPYQGRSEWNPTDAEVAQLPPYCKASLRPQLFPGPGVGAYNCDRFNHFCPALVAMNRAMNPMLPMTARRYNLRLAEDHLNYTRTHLSPGCRLVGDLQTAEQQTKIIRTLLMR